MRGFYLRIVGVKVLVPVNLLDLHLSIVYASQSFTLIPDLIVVGKDE